MQRFVSKKRIIENLSRFGLDYAVKCYMRAKLLLVEATIRRAISSHSSAVERASLIRVLEARSAMRTTSIRVPSDFWWIISAKIRFSKSFLLK